MNIRKLSLPLSKKSLALIGLAIAILIAGISYSIYVPSTPIVVKTSPIQGQVNINPNLPITIELNRPINPKFIQVSLSPPTQIELEFNKNITILNHPTLKGRTLYTVTVLYRNKAIHDFQFTTVSTQVDPTFNEGIRNELNSQYPLMALTPYSESSWSVVYSAPLTLEITLKTITLTPDAAISQVQSWVQSHGLDPSSHKYVLSGQDK